MDVKSINLIVEKLNKKVILNLDEQHVKHCFESIDLPKKNKVFSFFLGKKCNQPDLESLNSLDYKHLLTTKFSTTMNGPPAKKMNTPTQHRSMIKETGDSQTVSHDFGWGRQQLSW